MKDVLGPSVPFSDFFSKPGTPLSFSPSLPSTPHPRAPRGAPVLDGSSPRGTCFARGSVYTSALRVVRPTPPLPHCVHKSDLSSCISIPALPQGFISTVFLDSTSVRKPVSVFLTDLTLNDRL